MNETGLIDELRWAAPPGSGMVWQLAAAILLALLLAGVGHRWWKKRGLAIAEFREPAHVIALAALAKLRPLLEAGEPLPFTVEVSRILRTYIQERFGLRAPHRSTEEFLMEAAESPELPVSWQELLGDFLRQCDLVKFAQRRVSHERMEDLLATAERFVNETATTVESPAA